MAKPKRAPNPVTTVTPTPAEATTGADVPAQTVEETEAPEVIEETVEVPDEAPVAALPEADEGVVPAAYRVTKLTTVALVGFVGSLGIGKILRESDYDPLSWIWLMTTYREALGLEGVH